MQLEEQVDSVQILKKHELTRTFVAKSQNTQISRLLAGTEFQLRDGQAVHVLVQRLPCDPRLSSVQFCNNLPP